MSRSGGVAQQGELKKKESLRGRKKKRSAEKAHGSVQKVLVVDGRNCDADLTKVDRAATAAMSGRTWRALFLFWHSAQAASAECAPGSLGKSRWADVDGLHLICLDAPRVTPQGSHLERLPREIVTRS